MLTGFCLLAVLATPQGDLYAQTVYQNRNSANVPLTSLKCNEFTFDATRSEIPKSPNISFLWDFGDGLTSADPVVTHTYQKSGDYTVYLSITDNSGFECSSAITSQTVRVNIPPHASFISEDRSCVNEELVFDANTSYTDAGKGLDYSWNFGDGDMRQGASQVKKSYTKGGDYRVRLTVDDQSGTYCSEQTAEKMIHINEPPKANAGESEILKCVENTQGMVIDFDASETTDINQDPLTYIWDFGDGHKEKGVKVSHRYEETGNYDVRLIVSDNTEIRCGTSVAFVTVKLNQAPRANAGEDAVTCAGEKVKFDGSASYLHKKGTGLAQWFFGDGASSKGLYATHRYHRPGTYQATLSLENKLNDMCPVARDTRVVVVNSPPAVKIKSPASGCVSKEIFFDASSTADADGDDLQYHWNFGDGTAFTSGSKVSHIYDQGGRYRVNLIVDDQKKTTCSAATATANLHINTPPTADAGTNSSCCVEKETLFSASASSDPDDDRLTYTWDFGDGSKTQGENVTHTYLHEGSYNVQLTVHDHSGTSCGQSTDGFVATVREVPVPKINIR